jgi:alpha-beta hydrolase superfamily lysophospholipase
MTSDANLPVPDPAAAALRRAMPVNRLVDFGMDDADAMALRTGSAAGQDWGDVATALASAREGKSRQALAEGHPITALIQARWAAGAAWCAQLVDVHDTARKRALYEDFIQAIGVVASLTGMQRLEIPYRNGMLNGWLCNPKARSAATVIVVGGLSTWGVAQLRLADAITVRGLTCLLVEGPGQGEPRLRHSLFMDERVVDGLACFVDVVPPGPVGIIGNSLGGLFAALLAARDPRVSACVVNSGCLVPADAAAYRSLREHMYAACGSRDDETLKTILRELQFSPSRQPIACPVLSLHGGADRIVGLGDAQGFADASARGRLQSWPDGEHSIDNHARERDALVSDWLADELNRAAESH